MNFLQMCQRVRSECGVSGDGPSNVAGQTGMYAKIVNWVLASHEEIQLKHTNWKFDWATTTQTLTAGVEFYNPADWSLSVRNWDWNSLYVYRTVDNPSSRTWLDRIDYDLYRQVRTPAAPGRPVYATWMPDKRLGLYPIAEAGLTFGGDYYRTPQVMSGNTDEPRMPDEYHMAIVWRAVAMWSASEENPALLQTATQNFRSLMTKMEATELDGPFCAEALA